MMELSIIHRYTFRLIAVGYICHKFHNIETELKILYFINNIFYSIYRWYRYKEVTNWPPRISDLTPMDFFLNLGYTAIRAIWFN